MNVQEFIKENREVLNAIVRNGINPNWVLYEGMLEDYKRLKEEGHQQKNIQAYLAEQYYTSTRSVYRILTKLGEELI